MIINRTRRFLLLHVQTGAQVQVSSSNTCVQAAEFEGELQCRKNRNERKGKKPKKGKKQKKKKGREFTWGRILCLTLPSHHSPKLSRHYLTLTQHHFGVFRTLLLTLQPPRHSPRKTGVQTPFPSPCTFKLRGAGKESQWRPNRSSVGAGREREQCTYSYSSLS